MKQKLIASVMLAASVSAVQAATITTADGSGADAFIRSSLGGNNAADQNFGTGSGLGIKHDTALPGNNRKGYLRFDLSDVDHQVSGAELRLTFEARNNEPAANPSTYNVYGLNDLNPGERWVESLITWNNAPGNDSASAGGVATASTTFLGTFELSPGSATPGDTVSFGSGLFDDFVNADTSDLVTLIITRQQRNFAIEAFATKESIGNLAAPTLVAPVPIAAALPLLLSGLGLLGFLARRREP